jgi:putative holliday junction resolvase
VSTDAGGDPGEVVVRGVRLAVDVGSVRVGLASSDPDGLIATPVETLARDAARPRSGQLPSDIAAIVREVGDRCAALVYVGLPRHLSGKEGAASAAARAYAVALAHAVAPVPVRLVDERMSTVTAHQALQASGRSGRRHRQVVDQAAAVVILQSALDAERATGRRPGERVYADPRSHGPAARGGTAGDGSTTLE